MFKFRIVLFVLIIFCVPIISGCVEKKNESEAIDNPKKSVRKSSGNSDYFFFVGIIKNNSALYKYNFDKKEPVKFWSNENEKVIELSYSHDRKYAFFLTAENVSKLGVFPYLKNIRLYLLNTGSSNFFFIKKIGSGLQVFTSWETNSTFKIILNSPDKNVVTYVNQTTEYFNTYGKELINETKTYDITKDGYPKPPENKSANVSLSGMYKIFFTDSTTSSIFIHEASSGKNIMITSVDQKLKQVGWAIDGRFAIFSTINITPQNQTLNDKKPETSKIFIYSIKGNKIVKEWNGSGVKDFFIINNFLIFDDGFNNDSSIRIFEIESQKTFDIIKIKGGCGLRSIPQIPDYSA
ncbi:MAG: hypothetical protein ACYCVH_07085 [Ignavibacteriaceae bacterium]